jgi:endonuclease/exonuclease/phosphatase family metal-dependent hydrolase
MRTRMRLRRALLLASQMCSLMLCLVSSACIGAPQQRPLLRVMTWNIHHARGLDGEVDIDRIAAEIRAAAPDLVALQEVDRGVRRTGGLDIPAALAERTGMQVAFGKNIDYQGGDYGNAVLTRMPILRQHNHHYQMLRVGEQRGLLQVRVVWSGREIELWNTHIDYRPDDSERRLNATEILARQAASDVPVILCGDFNDLPGSAVHSQLTATFRDSCADDASAFTYPAATPKKRIDWVLLTPSWQVVEASVPETVASDHRGVVVVLR